MVLLFLWLFIIIPLTISLTYFLMGLLNVTTGIREKSNFKIKGGFKTIFIQ